MDLQFRSQASRRTMRGMNLLSFAHRLGLLTLLTVVGCHAPPKESAPPDPPPTLRALYDVPPLQAISASRTALVLVDFQQEFFSGKLPVDRGTDALQHAARLKRWAHEHDVLVVGVRNVAARPKSPIFAESSPTTAFMPDLEPGANDWLVVKHQAGAFSKTDLHARLQARGIHTIIVAGIMTHLAVDTTARDAAVLGYRVVVAADACATRPLPSPIDGTVIDAAELHRVALASLADRFAEIRRVDEILRLPFQV